MEEIIVDIDATGEVKVEARGVTGAGCQALTRAIEESLGRATADAKKPEYFQPATATQTAHGHAARNLR